MATLTFNMRDRELFLDGTDVPLTRREWQVVAALMRSGRLTDSELGSAMYLVECADGTDYSGRDFKSLVRYHIRNLRGKGVPITNRRTLGYKLDGEIEVQDESQAS